MLKGKIIYLEGVSSSGKTTLAKKLQTLLPEPFFCLSGDLFWDIAPPSKTFDNNLIFSKVDSAVIHTIQLFSDLGIDVIVDIVPVRMSNSMEKFVEILHEYPVLYVHVTCPLEELRRREKERGNRQIGLGERQLAWIAPQGTYDIILDTYNLSSEECANKIMEIFNHPERLKAFTNLYSQHSK